MKLLDVLTAPWAIEPAKLLEIQAIYATHLRGDKIDIAAVEQKLGRPLANEPQAYDIIDGVAILPIEGVIAKRANLFSQISGGVSTELVARDLQAAMNDPAVHSIILSIDSPGGTVDGTQTLANAVSASTKPIVTLASGIMASAAYWIGSAADAAYIVDSTTVVGSIGVVATHTDVSASEAQRGVKTTEIYAGQYKRIASSYGPLSDAGRQTIQDQVDYTYSLFVSAVAQQRGVADSKVLKDMADGRIFIGQQAIDAGLVDGVSTIQALVQQLNQDRTSGSVIARAGAAQQTPVTPSIQGKTMLTAEQVAANHPEAAAALRAQGATTERERIQAVEGQLIPGHEALINGLKFDGKSSAGDAAMAVNAAERQSRVAQATALANDAPNPLPIAPVAGHSDAPKPVTVKTTHAGFPVDATSAKLDAEAKRYQAQHPGTDYLSAVKAIQQGA
jgi:signal peptide peptidase SppA